MAVMAGDQTTAQAAYAERSASLYTPAGKGLYQRGAAGCRDDGLLSPGTRNLCDISKTGAGLLPHSFGDDNLFYRLWFSPAKVDLDFIVEDSEHAVKLWNAWPDQAATIADIAMTDTDGTAMPHDPLPITIPIFGEKTFTLTVFRDGPPLQNATYTFDCGEISFVLPVTGMRILAVTPEPNWEGGIDFSLQFSTVISSNKRFAEQRRPLLPRPLRGSKLAFLPDGLPAQQFFNTLLYGHDKVFGVPVYFEPLLADSIEQGENYIDVTGDISKHWHLNHQCDFILIVNHETLQNEIKSVSGISGNRIDCGQSIKEVFNPADAVIYPVFLALLESVSGVSPIYTLDEIEVSFTEFNRG